MISLAPRCQLDPMYFLLHTINHHHSLLPEPEALSLSLEASVVSDSAGCEPLLPPYSVILSLLYLLYDPAQKIFMRNHPV